jgi:DnaJ domain
MSRETEAFTDYYEVLHLHPEADAAMVDQAYWHLARLYNAAIPSDGTAREMLEELNEAYSVLRTPQLRDEYDALRDAVLGEGSVPIATEQRGEPPPLSVMAKQKPRPREAEESPLAEEEEPKERQRVRLQVPRLPAKFTLPEIVVPNWQSFVSLACMLILAGAALFAGAEPALVFFALIVGAGFTVIPVLGRVPRLPALTRPQVALPTIGPPNNLTDRMPRHKPDMDTLRKSTEAMRARLRENTADWETEPSPAADPPKPPLVEEAPSAVDLDSVRRSIHESEPKARPAVVVDNGAKGPEPDEEEEDGNTEEPPEKVDMDSLRRSTEAMRARFRESNAARQSNPDD